MDTYQAVLDENQELLGRLFQNFTDFRVYFCYLNVIISPVYQRIHNYQSANHLSNNLQPILTLLTKQLD